MWLIPGYVLGLYLSWQAAVQGSAVIAGVAGVVILINVLCAGVASLRALVQTVVYNQQALLRMLARTGESTEKRNTKQSVRETSE